MELHTYFLVGGIWFTICLVLNQLFAALGRRIVKPTPPPPTTLFTIVNTVILALGGLAWPVHMPFQLSQFGAGLASGFLLRGQGGLASPWSKRLLTYAAWGPKLPTWLGGMPDDGTIYTAQLHVGPKRLCARCGESAFCPNCDTCHACDTTDTNGGEA